MVTADAVSLWQANGMPAAARPADAGLSIVVPRVQRGRRACRRCTTASSRSRGGSRTRARLGRRGRLCRRRQPRRHARGRAQRCRPTRSTSRWCRCRAISARRRRCSPASIMPGFGAVLFMDGDGQHPPALIETLVGHWLDDGYDVVYTAKAHRANEPLAAPRSAVRRLLRADQLGRAAEDPGGRRRLPPAVAARRGGAAAAAGAQPLLQGPGELDRLPPDPRRLRAGRARARHAPTGTSVRLIGLSIEGLTSFSVAPLRLASLLGLLLAAAALLFGVQILFETLFYRQVGAGLSVAGGRPDGARRRAAHHDRDHGRIHRQDPLRDQSAAGLFRRRAQREDGARDATDDADARRGRMSRRADRGR